MPQSQPQDDAKWIVIGLIMLVVMLYATVIGVKIYASHCERGVVVNLATTQVRCSEPSP